MRFNAGYFGTCAVVLALLGTVLAGFILSVEKTTVPVTNYDYITDVSGLFDYDTTPAYVDYNPSTNYVGYTADTGTPKYTQTTTANNYRYIVSAGEVTTDTLTISNASSYNPDFAINKGWRATINPDSTVSTPFINFNWVGDSYNFGSPWIEPQFDNVPNNGRVRGVGSPIENTIIDIPSLQTVLLDAGLSGGFSSATITINQTGSYPVMFYAGDWRDYGYSTTRGSYPISDFSEDNVLPTTLVIDGATLIVKAYRNDALMWESSSNNVAVIYDYTARANGYSAVSCSATLDISKTGLPTYGYMNPNDGVTIDGSDISSSGWRAITWANGYENDKVTFKVLLNYENNNYKNIALNVYSGTSSSSQFSIQNDVHGAHFYYDRNGSYHPEILGYWPAVQVTLYASENKIVVTPTNDTSLLTVVDEQPYSFTLSNYLPAGTIDKIVFKNYLTASDPDRTATWQITSTSVFLNTYDTVMKDPSINIVSQFPDIYRDYRLNFYSFALYGESFTINGTNFAVDRNNATVTFQYGGQAVTQYLNNIYVTVDDLHTYLTFANVNQRYDLGATTTHVISFAGYWYFTTGLYEPVEGLQTVYNWDLNGAFHADAGQCLVIFFAILVGCVLIAHTYFNVNLRVYDWLIIGFAGFFAYVYFGGLIV